MGDLGEICNEGDMVSFRGLGLAALHDWRSGGVLRGILREFREGFGVLQDQGGLGDRRC